MAIGYLEVPYCYGHGHRMQGAAKRRLSPKVVCHCLSNRFHKARSVALISVSLAISQTPAYTVRQRIRDKCLCMPRLLLVFTAPTHGGMARLS